MKEQNDIKEHNDEEIDPIFLMQESGSSVGFTNILFVVSFGFLALVSEKLQHFPAVAVLLLVIVLATFYSSIFYVAVSGSVARIGHTSESANKMLLLGNALSEYLGVLLIITILPTMVSLIIEGQSTLAWVCFGVSLFGNILYALSGFDIFSRILPPEWWSSSRFLCRIIHLCFIWVPSAWILCLVLEKKPAWGPSVFLLVVLSISVICHIREKEKRHASQVALRKSNLSKQDA